MHPNLLRTADAAQTASLLSASRMPEPRRRGNFDIYTLTALTQSELQASRSYFFATSALKLVRVRLRSVL